VTKSGETKNYDSTIRARDRDIEVQWSPWACSRTWRGKMDRGWEVAAT